MTHLNVQTPPLGLIQTNCYLIWPEGETACWIIDPGGLPGPIISVIERNKLEPKKIIITHGHWDHFMGNRCLKDKFPHAKIAIHESDARVLPDADANLSLALIGKAILSPPADEFLKDGDNLQLGSLTFRVIHTPGHSPGGVCLHCEDPDVKSVFVGDLIFAGGGVGRTDLPGSSTRDLHQSIKRVFKLIPDETVVYPGHGPTTTIGEEKESLNGLL